jgi:hypothetical protein
MDPEAIGRQYDQIADHWQEPHLQSNGVAQFEKAFSPPADWMRLARNWILSWVWN